MDRIVLSTVIILFIGGLLFAQETDTVSLSLHQCVQTAVEENINIRTARIDHENSRYKRAEAISAIVPKISVGVNFQDNISLPTTMVPGEIFGQSGTTVPVQMGAKFNTNANATVSWVLYNQTALTAIQLAQKMSELGDLNIEKVAEELAAEVAKLYFLAVVTNQQKQLVENNIARTKRLRDIIGILTDNGMAKQVDYERISINLENFYTQLSNVKAGLEHQHNMMKYMLNIPLTRSVVLTDTSEIQLLQNMHVNFSDFSGHIDVRLLEAQQEINLISQRIVKNGYMPSLSFTGQYAIHGMRSQFRNYFNDSPENRWLDVSYIGLNLSVPIFDGGEKRAKSLQAKMDYQRTAVLLTYRNEKFMADYQNAVNDYNSHRKNLERQKQNIALAEKVYRETALKYREGLAGMSDLLQDEMSLNAAQAAYLNALFNYREAEIKIMSLTGDITTLYNQVIN